MDSSSSSSAKVMPRLDTSAKNDSEAKRSTTTSTAALTALSGVGSVDSLPAVILVQIAAFSPASSFSGACRSTLSAIRELHYKMNMRRSAPIVGLDKHMGLQPSGALATGRVVTRITVDVIGQEDHVSTN